MRRNTVCLGRAIGQRAGDRLTDAVDPDAFIGSIGARAAVQSLHVARTRVVDAKQRDRVGVKDRAAGVTFHCRRAVVNTHGLGGRTLADALAAPGFYDAIGWRIVIQQDVVSQRERQLLRQRKPIT